MKVISLRDRFIFLTLIYSLILLGGLLLFFDIHEKTNLKKQAQQNVEMKLNLFETVFAREIQNIESELSVLISRMSGISYQKDPNAIRKIYITFFKNHAFKYKAILWKVGGNQLQAQPIRELGALDVIIEKTKIRNTKPEQATLSMGNFGHTLECIPIEDLWQPHQIIAQVYFSYLLECVLDQIFLLPPYTFAITDSSNRIQYAVDLQQINRPKYSLFNKSMRYVHFQSRPILKSDLNLTISYQWENEFITWRNKMTQGGLFAFMLIIIAIFISALIGHKISRSIQTVSEKAMQVANGQFDVSLPANRKDEFGGLFSAFNQMTSKLKSSYSMLQQMNKELETHVHELQTTRQELSRKQRLALLGEAISKISHEIQNKIGGVHIWVQNIERIMPKDENTQLHLVELKKSIMSLMDRLVHFKRFYREPQLDCSKIKLHEWIPQAANSLTMEFENKELKILFNIDNDLPQIMIDPIQMHDALTNLLLNAVYYSPVKGKLIIAAFSKDQTVNISIHDQGPGIQGDCETLFQPFYTTKSSGSGLGLAIVQKIIMAHGGSLTCANHPDGGAIFTIQLPINSLSMN